MENFLTIKREKVKIYHNFGNKSQLKKGSYDSISFEEEDLEDDDYYFEDDLDK